MTRQLTVLSYEHHRQRFRLRLSIAFQDVCTSLPESDMHQGIASYSKHMICLCKLCTCIHRQYTVLIYSCFYTLVWYSHPAYACTSPIGRRTMAPNRPVAPKSRNRLMLGLISFMKHWSSWKASDSEALRIQELEQVGSEWYLHLVQGLLQAVLLSGSVTNLCDLSKSTNSVRAQETPIRSTSLAKFRSPESNILH